MNYVTSMKTAILIFPIIAFFFTIPFILYQYHKYGSIHKFRSLIIYSFILYMIVIYFLVILPLPSPSTVSYHENMVRVIPFQFISDFIRESSFEWKNFTMLKEPCFYTVLFNILMTIPFGMYLRYYFQCNMKKTILSSFLLSFFFEVTQLSGLYFIYDYPYRVFDVDDLILNTLGGVVGYKSVGILMKYLPTRKKIDEVSYEQGKVVSGFRRITLFFLDLFLYIVFLLLISSFYQNKYLTSIVFLIYYLILPLLLGERTLGSIFLNVRMTFPNHQKIRYTIRVFYLLLYYFIFPSVLLRFTRKTTGHFFFFLFLSIFYLKNIHCILRKRKIYYDDLLKVEYISTLIKK